MQALDAAAGVAGLAARFVFLAVLVPGAGALGRVASGSRRRGVAALAWDVPAGLAVLAAVLLAVGLLPGMFFRGRLLAAAFAVLAAAWIADRRRHRGVDASGEGFPAGPARAALIAVLALAAAAGFAWDRVPAVFHDTLAYHFAQPNLWLANGRIAPEPWSLHSWFPPGMSVLYGLGMAAAGEAAANDVNLLFGLCLAAMAADLSRRFWDPWTGTIAAVAILTLPVTIHAIGIPAADLGHGVFVLGSVGAVLLDLDRAGSEREGGWLRVASVFAAGAALTKYLGFLVPLGIGSALLAAVDRGRLRRAAPFVLPAAASLAAWLGANAVATGNPVAPVGASLVQTRGLAPGGAAAFSSDARGGLPGPDDGVRLFPRLVAGSPVDDRLYPTPAWGWVPVLLVPAALLVPGDRRLRRVLAAAALLFGFWFSTYRWERFLVAAGGLLAVGCAVIAVALWRRGGPWRAVPLAAAILAGLGALRAGESVLSFTGGAPVLLGLESPRDFVRRGFPLMNAFSAANASLDPRRHRILILGDERHHRLDIPHAAPTGFNVHPLAERIAAGDGPVEAWAVVRRQGFTHVIVDAAGAGRAASRYPSLRSLPAVPGGWLAVWAPLGPPDAIASGRPVLVDLGEDRP